MRRGSALLQAAARVNPPADAPPYKAAAIYDGLCQRRRAIPLVHRANASTDTILLTNHHQRPPKTAQNDALWDGYICECSLRTSAPLQANGRIDDPQTYTTRDHRPSERGLGEHQSWAIRARFVPLDSISPRSRWERIRRRGLQCRHTPSDRLPVS